MKGFLEASCAVMAFRTFAHHLKAGHEIRIRMEGIHFVIEYGPPARPMKIRGMDLLGVAADAALDMEST